MAVLPGTAERVPEHTPASFNRAIRLDTDGTVRWYAEHPEHINDRLETLEREWDIERMLEANASTLAFVGTLLGAFVSPYWLILPALVTLFLFQHAVQGWCPPLPILRKLGFRTSREIDTERYALKVLRGDFGPPAQGEPAGQAQRALQAVRR